jgi:hypothetical protein
MEQAVKTDAWALVEPGARSSARYPLALITGTIFLGAVLVLDVPGVADIRSHRSAYTVLSHLALALIVFGLSPRFRGWVAQAASLPSSRQVQGLAVAIVGPLVVMAVFGVVAPRYAHELLTREWGIVEPLQFVLWLTAAWLAFERARRDVRGGADHHAFRLAGGACILMALEEVDYLGVVSLVARAAGVPNGRIGGQHIGGFHDLVNAVGKVSLLLSLLAVGVVTALVIGWVVSRGLHRVAFREIVSPTTLPLLGTVAFLAIAQLADIDHPALQWLEALSVEEPMELMAVVCVNASLIAKLAPWMKRCS